MEKVKPTLQLEDEIGLHEKGWIVQRIGWALMMLLIVAASLGTFGSGWLSQQSESRERQSLAYERFARLESPMVINVTGTSVNGVATISVPQSYLEDFEVKQITPTPSSQRSVGESIVYAFECTNRITVRFHVEPQVVGSRITHIEINEVDFVLRHFIYP